MEIETWLLYAAKGLIITVVAMLVLRAMRRNSAAARHLVGTLAVAGLLGLPLLAWWLPTWHMTVPGSKDWIAPATPTNIHPSVPVFSNPKVAGEMAAPVPPPSSSIANPTPVGRKPIDMKRVATAVWLGIAALALLIPLMGLIQINRLRRRARPVSDESWQSLKSALCDQLGIRRSVQLLSSDAVKMPLTWGFVRPVVLLPIEAGQWPDTRRHMVMLHELAHIRRFDWLTQLLGQIACAVHWFNPMAWWLLRRMESDREQACDDLVLAAGTRPSDYAEELVRLAAVLRKRTLATIAAVPMARQSNLESRVRAILDRSKSRTAITVLTTLIAIIVCVLVLAPLASMRTRTADSVDHESNQLSILESMKRGSTDKNNDSEQETPNTETLSLTPTGICEAVRDGNLALVKTILAEKPELLKISNPANWAHLPEMRVHPWASRPVEIAAIFGHADVVAYLLSISETEENPTACYYEVLQIAQKMEDPAVLAAVENDFIRRITDEPDLIEYAQPNGSTMLHFAAGHANMRLMTELLERGADSKASTDKGRRAIHYVIGDNAQTRLLLQYGEDYTLWVAAALGDLNRAREILTGDPSQVAVDFHPSSIHSHGMPLVIAATGGKLDMVRLLLEHGADVNGQLPGREFADKGLALLHSFTNGHLDVVHLLLDHGADVDAWVDSNYNFKYRVKESGDQRLKERVFTAEELAAPVKSPSFTAWTGEIVGNIRELPAPSPSDALGTINAAIVSHNRHNDYANYKEIITVMLEQGADQNAAMKTVTEEEKAAALKRRYWHREYGTPLHWLSTAYLNKANYSPNPDIPTREELVDLAGLFVDYGADLEARHPISNHTPLSSAVEKGIPEYVDFLLKNGAKVHRNDPPETNPVEIAARLGFKEISRLLQ